MASRSSGRTRRAAARPRWLRAHDGGSTARELARRRAAMDRLNRKLLDVLQERARLALEIARWKHARGITVPDPAREREMLEMLLAAAPEGFDRDTLARLLRDIFRASRRLVVRDVAGATSPAGTHQKIWNVVRRIPRGRVATYGQVAALAGFPRQPRLAGYALHALPDGTNVPWHRVVNARGAISLPATDGQYQLQRALLEGEGVVFRSDRIDLKRYGWKR